MVTLQRISWTAGFTNVFTSFVFYLRDVRLSFASSFLVVNATLELVVTAWKIVNKASTAVVISIGREHNTKHWAYNFCIGLDFKLLSTSLFCPSRKPEQSPCHLELDVGHICSYGYLCVWVCVCHGVCVCARGEGASVCSSLHKKGTLWKCLVRRGHSRLIWTGLKQRYSEGNRKKIKYIYYSILCRIFIGLLCHWSHALRWPCSALYHVIIIHRLVPMTRGWFDCFFMSSVFFAINAFVLKQILSVFFCICLQL